MGFGKENNHCDWAGARTNVFGITGQTVGKKLL